MHALAEITPAAGNKSQACEIHQAWGANIKTVAVAKRLKHHIKSRLIHARRNTVNPTKS
jgi:hypothetical protein